MAVIAAWKFIPPAVAAPPAGGRQSGFLGFLEALLALPVSAGVFDDLRGIETYLRKLERLRKIYDKVALVLRVKGAFR